MGKNKSDFTTWYEAQYGRPAPTIERSLLLRQEWERLEVAAGIAKMNWEREDRALMIYDAALKGYQAGKTPAKELAKAVRGASGKRVGGIARWVGVPAKERTRQAREMANARWSKAKKKKKESKMP